MGAPSAAAPPARGFPPAAPQVREAAGSLGWSRGPGMELGEGARGEILRRCLIFRSHDDGSRSSTSIPALLK